MKWSNVMSKEKFYLATAIAYTSGKPHIGNVYETILADAIARYKRNRGFDVLFQTGTDEHGQKIEEKAMEQGISPKAFTDIQAGVIRDIYDQFNISYDQFVRTTDEQHVLSVQKIFQKLYDQEDIYKGVYEGWYCVPDESFFTDAQLVDGKCPDCGRDVEKTKEETYFFNLAKYQDRLEQYYADYPDFIVPTSRKNEMLNNFIKPGLLDLSVSRSSFKWGIDVPFDKDHVIYVWIDALSNYITGLGYDADGNHSEQFKKYWPADLILIGKDIVRFHTIYWPILLMALGLEQTKQMFGHPWLLIGDGKMSKSKGNTIYPDQLASYFGVDAVRFYVLKEIPYAHDGTLTYDLMIDQINTNLANVYGNLVNRTISMTNQYKGGHVTRPTNTNDLDSALKQDTLDAISKYEAKFDEYKVADAISVVIELLRKANKYIDETTPWILAKDEAQSDRLNDVLYNLLEVINKATIMLEPIIPSSAQKYLDMLKSTMVYEELNIENVNTEYNVVEETEIIFSRIDHAKKIEEIEADTNPQINTLPLIDFDHFKQVEMVVGQVVSSRKHPDAKKLLISEVDVKTGIVQVVSGIADWQDPSELVGKKVIVVTNLQPVKLRGVESAGMLLVAKNGKVMELLSSDLPVGSSIE